jgi:DNA-binding MarR family transcriptional regulator
MNSVPRSRHEDSILRSLRRIVRAIDLHSRDLESGFGLTGPQLVCMRVIATQGPMTPSELAREVDLSQATVTGIVDRLARRQYISRRRTTKDRRRVRLAILPAGQDLLTEAPSPLQTRFAAELASLPEENQAVIDMMLGQIVRMMGAEGLDAAPMLASGDPGAPASVGNHELIESRDADGPALELRLAADGGDDDAG